MLWTRTPAPPMRYSRRRNAAASAMLIFGCMKKAGMSIKDIRQELKQQPEG